MARPQKNNADYFPHDNGMWSDRKVVALRNKFGLEGYAIWNLLLESLCESENFELNETEQNLLPEFWGIEEEKLKEILDFMERLKLIQREQNTITCQRLVDRLQPMLLERARKRKWARKRWEKDGNSEEIDDDNTSNSEQSTESSTQKERKEKESKGKKSKPEKEITPAQKARKFFKEIEEQKLPDEDERQKFYNYWTELSKSGKKQRWELERTFDVDRRWKTWQQRASKFNNSNYGKNKQDNRIPSGHVSTEGEADLVV